MRSTKPDLYKEASEKRRVNQGYLRCSAEVKNEGQIMSGTQVTSVKVAVRYRQNGISVSIDTLTDCCTTTLGRRIDQNTGLVSVEISADISVDMSVNMSTDTSGSIHRPSVSQHGHDISVEHWSICRPTCRSMGAQNKHDPRNIDEPTEAQEQRMLMFDCHTCMLQHCEWLHKQHTFFPIRPKGSVSDWNFNTCTHLCPLYTTSWRSTGQHIGLTVPSMNPKQFLKGAPWADSELAYLWRGGGIIIWWFHCVNPWPWLS